METERLISLVGKNPARETVPRPLLRLVINVDNISGASTLVNLFCFTSQGPTCMLKTTLFSFWVF